jgi:general secretion pathway protein D
MVNFPSSGVGIAGVPVDPGTQANLLGLGGFSLAYLGPEIMVNGQPVRGMGALANALVDTADANILSTPNLLTLDNAEAKIVVGENVPFLTGSYAQTTGGTGTPVTPFQTIERKDIGLTLVIKPQISEGGAIKLEIQQEVSSVSQSTVTGASDLITNKRALETTVVVDDGNTVVLGGLIKDDIQRNRQKVPGLGSIPILGALFRYKSDTKVKTNLMVFLRPTIIRSPLDSHRVTTDRYQQLIERGKRFSDEQKIMMDRLRPAKPDAKSETQADPQGEEKLGPSNVGNE